jgi:hypothetical protein
MGREPVSVFGLIRMGGKWPARAFSGSFFCESSSSCGTDCRIPSVPRHRIAPPLPPVDPHPCALRRQTHLRDRSRRHRSLPGTASPRIRGGACGSARARSSEEQEYSGGLVADAGSHDSRSEEDPGGACRGACGSTRTRVEDLADCWLVLAQA